MRGERPLEKIVDNGQVKKIVKGRGVRSGI